MGRGVSHTQGMAFAKHVFGDDPQAKPDYEFIPSAVFSSPPIANVGLSEEEAVAQYRNVDVFTSSYKCAPAFLSIVSAGKPCFLQPGSCVCTCIVAH